MNNKLYAVLSSPRVWALFLALVFIVAKIIWPVMPLNQTDVIAAVLSLVAFVASASLNGVPSYQNLIGQFKFWSLVVSLLFIFIRAFVPAFPLTQDQVLELIGAFGTFSIGTSYRQLNTNLNDPANTGL